MEHRLGSYVKIRLAIVTVEYLGITFAGRTHRSAVDADRLIFPSEIFEMLYTRLLVGELLQYRQDIHNTHLKGKDLE